MFPKRTKKKKGKGEREEGREKERDSNHETWILRDVIDVY